ncbi:EAL domain-containing protein [Devosia sp. LC5]|uniref:EAL domain-containing protein n=1 Tax=Devosia sp. LC5 TaxID=1502724 RepID=UPI00068975DC
MFKPIRLDDFEIIPGASMGVAIYPDNAGDKETLINNADLAMYRAKADIARAACFYERSMDEMVRARRNLADELREALETNQLDVHYQVQTSLSTGEIRGYEALLRWGHSQRGYIPPAEFIPLAEENGLILQMGEWVLRTACAKAASWEPPYGAVCPYRPAQAGHGRATRNRAAARPAGAGTDRVDDLCRQGALAAYAAPDQGIGREHCAR